MWTRFAADGRLHVLLACCGPLLHCLQNMVHIHKLLWDGMQNKLYRVDEMQVMQYPQHDSTSQLTFRHLQSR